MPSITGTLTALAQRLHAVAPYLVDEPVDAQLDHGPLLALLADHVATDPRPATVWLLCTAAAGGFPTSNEVDAVRRGLELAAPGTAMAAVLAGIAVTASAVHGHDITAEVVPRGVVVDVDFCATHAHNTGIQRVVRRTIPHWNERDGATLVAWSSDKTGYRRLTPGQQQLVLEWESGMVPAKDPEPSVLVIPWNSVLAVPEVPDHAHIERMAAIARSSGNRVGLIGYDAIPIVSAETMVDDESDRFSHYLSIVKHADTVAAISQTTADEFTGFVSGLAAQGLTGPRVTTLPLPVTPPRTHQAGATPPDGAPARPLVLTVGSLEPRKNQYAVLGAAQNVWDQGHDFELLFIGGGSAWFLDGFDRDVVRLQQQGRPVSRGKAVTDADLEDAYRRARVVVFPSLQEGYGLPVAEALASGTPVITTRYGATAEIAQQGGCLLVDPRDVGDIAAAITRVLTDDELHAKLVAELADRTDTTWPEYAAELWDQLVGGSA